MTKLVRDIEWLLQWAVRDELPKERRRRRRVRPAMPCPWDKIRIGTRIDVSYRNSDPFEFAWGGLHDDVKGGEPHDDAKAIARAVNALSSDQSFPDIERVRAL